MINGLRHDDKQEGVEMCVCGGQREWGREKTRLASARAPILGSFSAFPTCWCHHKNVVRAVATCGARHISCVPLPRAFLLTMKGSHPYHTPEPVLRTSFGIR